MRRVAAWAVGAVVVAALVVVVGRWERSRERAHNLHGIELVRRLVGDRVSHPFDYRVSPGLTCLIYPTAASPIALELCVDPYGRIVEAVDRRGAYPAFYSVTSEPAVATLRLDPTAANRWVLAIETQQRKK